MLPVLLRLDERLCVVVGGGPVGCRRAQSFLDAGALVRQIALEPCPVALPRLEWLHTAYEIAHLHGATLVCAAATPTVNRQVVADARACNLWVNSASDPDASDFHVPSVLRRGPLLLSLSSSGLAPAFTRRLRQQLEDTIDAAHGDWLTLLGEVRPWILAHVADPPRRAAVWRALCHPDWLELVRQAGCTEARRQLWTYVQTLADEGPSPL